MTAGRQHFGAFLALQRGRRGLTQAAVASELGYTSPQFVSNWERGASLPPREQAPDIAKALGIRPTRWIREWRRMRALERVAEERELREAFR